MADSSAIPLPVSLQHRLVFWLLELGGSLQAFWGSSAPEQPGCLALALTRAQQLVCVLSLLLACFNDLQGAGFVLRKHPSVVLIPGLVCVVVLVVGLTSLLLGTYGIDDCRGDGAQKHAAMLVQSINGSAAQVSAAIGAMMSLVTSYPSDVATITGRNDTAFLKRVWKHTLARDGNNPGADTYVTRIAMAPLGFLGPAFFTNLAPSSGMVQWQAGQDMLAASWPLQQTAQLSLMNRATTSRVVSSDGDGITTVVHPVILASVRNTQSLFLGTPYSTLAAASSRLALTSGLNTTGWWGMIVVEYNVSALIETALETVSQTATGKGYQFTVQVQDLGSGLSSSTPDNTPSPQQVWPGSAVGTVPSHAETASLTLATTQVIVSVWTDEARPAYEPGLITLITVTAVALSGYVMYLQLCRVRHRAMLEQVVPPYAIKRMYAEWDWGPKQTDKSCSRGVGSGTPADQILDVINGWLSQGKQPSVSELVSIRDALNTGVDVYRPVIQDLGRRMMEANVDDEVKMALIAQLTGGPGLTQRSPLPNHLPFPHPDALSVVHSETVLTGGRDRYSFMLPPAGADDTQESQYEAVRYLETGEETESIRPVRSWQLSVASQPSLPAVHEAPSKEGLNTYSKMQLRLPSPPRRPKSLDIAAHRPPGHGADALASDSVPAAHTPVAAHTGEVSGACYERDGGCDAPPRVSIGGYTSEGRSRLHYTVLRDGSRLADISRPVLAPALMNSGEFPTASSPRDTGNGRTVITPSAGGSPGDNTGSHRDSGHASAGGGAGGGAGGQHSGHLGRHSDSVRSIAQSPGHDAAEDVSVIFSHLMHLQGGVTAGGHVSHGLSLPQFESSMRVRDVAPHSVLLVDTSSVVGGGYDSERAWHTGPLTSGPVQQQPLPEPLTDPGSSSAGISHSAGTNIVDKRFRPIATSFTVREPADSSSQHCLSRGASGKLRLQYLSRNNSNATSLSGFESHRLSGSGATGRQMSHISVTTRHQQRIESNNLPPPLIFNIDSLANSDDMQEEPTAAHKADSGAVTSITPPIQRAALQSGQNTPAGADAEPASMVTHGCNGVGAGASQLGDSASVPHDGVALRARAASLHVIAPLEHRSASDPQAGPHYNKSVSIGPNHPHAPTPLDVPSTGHVEPGSVSIALTTTGARPPSTGSGRVRSPIFGATLFSRPSVNANPTQTRHAPRKLQSQTNIFQGAANSARQAIQALRMPSMLQSRPSVPTSSGPLMPLGSGQSSQPRPSVKPPWLSQVPTDHPHRPIFTQLDSVLATCDNWRFDAYALEEASQGHPLSVLGFWLFHATGLMRSEDLSRARLVRFLQRVEEGYSSANPYHNRRHAADVLQSMHVLLHQGGLAPGYVDRHTMLACYLAAIVHDYEHRGRTNDFLVLSQDDLATRYNDRSPMENHHLAAAFALIKQPEYNFLKHMPRAQFDSLRKLVIELVLSTDMKQHFSVCGQFSSLHKMSTQVSIPPVNNNESPRVTGERGNMLHSKGQTSGDSGAHSPVHPPSHDTPPLQPLSDADKLVSLQMALKCSDLGHWAAPLQVHLRWVQALEAEFFQQGDAERALGLPISPLCDRNKEGVTKSQLGFFDFVVRPLFQSFTSRFHQSKPLLMAVMENFAHWQAVSKGPPSTPSSHAINISPTAANGLQSQHSAAVPMTPSSHTLRGVRFDVGSGGRDMPVSPMLASRPPLPHAPHAALGRTTTSERTPFTEAVAGHVFMSPSTVHAGAHSRSPPQQSQRVGLKELTTQQSPSSSPDSAVRHAKAQAAVQAALASVPRRQRNKPTKRSLLEDMSVWETNPQK